MLLMDAPFNPFRDVPSDVQILASNFAEKWADYQGNEVQNFQAHFNELCEIVGHITPSDELDDHDFEFNKSVRTTTGVRGEADVFLRDHFIMEYKKPGLNLDEAYYQNLRYRDGLGNPPLLIVADFTTIRIHTNFTGKAPDIYTISLDDLKDIEQNAKRKNALGEEGHSPLSVYQVLRYCFFDTEYLEPSRTTEDVTEAAADIFKRIASDLQQFNTNKDTEIARFLSQLLFCMFSSDIRLLPKQLMTDYTLNLGDSPAKVFPLRLSQLFQKMSVGDQISVPPIRCFNGGLFDGRPNNLHIGNTILPLVREADALDWSQIEPAIFGTLFERIYNPEKRAQHGRHLTSRADIETLVEPVVMTPLRRDWEKVRSTIRAADTELAKVMTQDFIDRLGKVRILDPACGSGNFLYVALNLMHDLEREVIRWTIDFGVDPPEPRVHPGQLLGIEIDEYAHQLASVVVWIGHLQNESRVGNVLNRNPVLDPIDNIDCRDAIVDTSGSEPKPAEWPEADFIVGNPPFLGNHLMRPELGEDYVDQLYAVWGGDVSARGDLCTFWFERARRQIESTKAKRAGLLATQSIRFTDSRLVLENIKESGDIFFAESDRDWLLEGAAVHISMVGFDDGSEQSRILDGRDVERIHANLTDLRVDLTVARPLKENSGLAFKGTDRTGPFDINENLARDMLNASNPDGRPNSDVIKPFLVARDVADISRNYWIIDFGVEMSEDEARKYEFPFAHVEEYVKPYRAERPKLDTPWWLFTSTRPGMRAALRRLKRYIATPRVSKHRVFVWVDSKTLPDGALVVFARDDDYFMGVLQSRVHEVWAMAMGSQVRDRASGFRYTHTTCFDTFPFPEPTDDQRKEIADAAETLIWHRKNSLSGPYALKNMKKQKNTLTNLYNRYPSWLKHDHSLIDRAVFDAYGWTEDPTDLDDESILERLLDLNLSRGTA